MKIIVKLYRTTTVPTSEVLAAAGMDPDTEGPSAPVMHALREKYGPFPPRFEFFLPADTSVIKTVIGMETMSFDVPEANLPKAGLVLADPMTSQDIDRVDGAIESELGRMGISTNFEGYEWRLAFRTKGN